MNEDRHVAQDVDIPRNGLDVPQHKAGEQQKNRAANHRPKVEFLSPIEASDGRKFVVIILYVGFNVICPHTIVVIDFHIAAPVQEHQELGHGKKNAEPWVPESRRWSAAYNRGHPVEVRCPESQAGDQTVGICYCAKPMVHALDKRVTPDELLVEG